MRTHSLVALALTGGLALSTLPTLLGQGHPTVHDDRLTLTLFAETPDIVTPIGLAVGPRDEIYVVESHTHLAPANYPGPKGDRILVFTDTNQDGQADRRTVFAEDLEAAMNLTVTADGRVFVVGARAVWELVDADRDGQSESRRTIVTVDTTNTYPHSCLLSITHDQAGWLYLGRGNNGSAAYTLQGTDASQVSGYGDGGNITRCRWDGSQLELFATGFWNPFDIEFDQSGHLLAVDNDPDARGPNRLVHVVPHGDYGYQSLYGGSGNHPYQGWDGSLPGTLPYVSGTGEAPSGLLDARRGRLPADYQKSILVTVWNEHTIENHPLQAKGTSFEATPSILVSGPQNFRPVALDSDRHGNIYITDWVQVDYPNHGQGRIWRLAAKPEASTKPPEAYDGGKHQSAGTRRLQSIRQTSRSASLLEALASSDPFERQAAIRALAKPTAATTRAKAIDSNQPLVRLGGLLAEKASSSESALRLPPRFLQDPDPSIRQAAMQWIGEAGLAQYRQALLPSLSREPSTSALFETYLATTEVLNESFLEGYRTQAEAKANRLPLERDPQLVRQVINDPALSPNLRALAIAHYPHQSIDGAATFLQALAEDGPIPIRKAAIQSLAELSEDTVPEQLTRIATDPNQPLALRCDSLAALDRFPLTDLDPYLKLTRDPEPKLVLAALRLLHLYIDDSRVKQAFNRAYVIYRNRPKSDALVEQLEDTLYPDPGCCQPRVTHRPQSPEEWQFALRKGGDPEAGRRVFFSLRASCSQCHTINHRGGKLGPDLSNAGQSVNRSQLIHSILKPSDQFPPQFQAWIVETKDGEEHRGLQLDHKAKGAIELYTLLGQTEHFSAEEIDRYYAAQRSLMPDGLEAGLTTSEMRDLVAFLESLR